MEWQTIDTAPRDGTEVWVSCVREKPLFVSPGGWASSCYSTPEKEAEFEAEQLAKGCQKVLRFQTAASFQDGFWSSNHGEGLYGSSAVKLKPTHWMPLPQPPKP